MKLASVFLLSAAFAVPPKVLSVPLYFNDRAAFDAAADSLSDLESFDGRRLKRRRFRRRFERFEDDFRSTSNPASRRFADFTASLQSSSGSNELAQVRSRFSSNSNAITEGTGALGYITGSAQHVLTFGFFSRTITAFGVDITTNGVRTITIGGSGISDSFTAGNNPTFWGVIDILGILQITFTTGTSQSGTEPVIFDSASYDIEVISPAPTYNITLSESRCEFTADITSIGTVTCTFEANGDSNHVVDSVLFGPDCSADTNAGLTQVSTDFTPNGESSTYAVSVSIDNNALEVGGESVAFCIQASVKAGGSDDVYAQLGQRVRLDLATDGFFSFGTTPAVADSISAEADALDTTLTVGAYQCDESGTETSDPLSLDDTLYICIDGKQDTVIIDAIENLQAEKSGVSPLSIIDDGSAIINPAITAVDNLDSNKAIVTTKLPLTFFKSTEPVTVSGNAEIKAGGSGQPSNTEFTCPLGTITPGTVSNKGDCCEDADCVPGVVSKYIVPLML